MRFRRNILCTVGATALLGIVAPMLGCAAKPDGATDDDEPLRGAVLIVLDTLRADHVACYGYARNLSPNLDALAREGIRFEQVVAPSPWTLPSVAGLLAGEYPARVLEGQRATRSLVESLAGHGFATAAFTEGGYVSREFGLDLGFRDFTEQTGQLRVPARRGPDGQGGIAETFARAEQWLRDLGDERFFLLIHTYEPHTPYTNDDFAHDLDPGRLGPVLGTDLLPRLRSGELALTDTELEYATALYDGDILNTDRFLGAFRDFLHESGLWDRTLLVVTSDHGEELGDHYPSYNCDHGHSLRDPLLLVPLVLRDPRRQDGGRSVPSQVRLIDVLPTMAELLDVSIEEPIDGRSLLPVLGGAELRDRTAFAGMVNKGPRRIAVRTDRLKFIMTVGPGQADFPLEPEPPAQQLYDLAADPRERVNLVNARPRLAAALRELIIEKGQDLARADRDNRFEAIDPEVRERLRSLGYVD